MDQGNLHDMEKPIEPIGKINELPGETVCNFDSTGLTFPYYDMYSVTYNYTNSQYTSSSSSSSPSPSMNQPEQQQQQPLTSPPNETSFNESDLINGNSDFIGESNFPLNQIEPIIIRPTTTTLASYPNQVYTNQFTQQHHHQNHQQQMSLPTTSDYRETGFHELTYTTNGNHANYNNTVNETLWSLNAVNCSSSSLPQTAANEHRSRSYSFSHYESSSNLNNHHNHNHNHYPYLCPYSSMETPTTEPTTGSTLPIGSFNQNQHLNVYSTPTLTSNPSTNNWNFNRPFASLSSNSSCSTSSLVSSASSTADQDYLFTIDDGDLSSCSSTASSTYSSSSSSNLTRAHRKRINLDDHSRTHRGHHRSKLTKKEKLDKMMSEDKRLESENSILKEQIRVMEHQFKILQTKITNILIDAAKKEG